MPDRFQPKEETIREAGEETTQTDPWRKIHQTVETLCRRRGAPLPESASENSGFLHRGGEEGTRAR